jgi:hypothetical protein
MRGLDPQNQARDADSKLFRTLVTIKAFFETDVEVTIEF